MESFVAKFVNSRELNHTFKLDAKNGWIGTSTFTTNDIGISATNFDDIVLYHNDFRDIDGTSVELSNIDHAVFDLNTIDEAPSNYNYSVVGIDLDQVGFASISNGYIKECITGILSEGSNVFLRDGVIVSDNVVGVDFGDTNLPDFALTVGDKGCANIINNDVGVRGENIILNIDAIEHAVNNGGTPPKANRFDGNTTLFDICYTAPTIVNDNPTILMKGNYWGGGSFWSNTSTFKIDLAFGSPACGTTVNIDDSEFVTTIPGNCDWIMSQTPQTPVPTKVKCEFINGNNDNVLVHEQARLAFIDLAQDNFIAAKSKYQPIADLSSQDINYEAACLHKIYFARCMTKGLGDNLDALIAILPNENNGWDEGAIAYSKSPIENFTIFPNPANDFIFIQNKQNVEFEILIYNTFGQQVLTSEFTKELNLDVNSFETGIYILDIIDKSSKERIQKKIVIQ
ncbi:MAG: T9SS type A sorting domain-containing protein [Saprospiraceae bacterium]